MGIEVITEFIAKATVRVRAYVYDDDDALVDATTSIKVIITDPSGTTVVPSAGNGDDDMTKAATGTYTLDYKTTTSTTKGWYNVQVIVIDGSGDTAKTSLGTSGFNVT